MSEICSFYDQKSILLIGSCGSIGTSLVNYIYRNLNPSRLLCIDCNESLLFAQSLQYRSVDTFNFRLGDPTTLSNLSRLVDQFDIVINVAARKNVVMCERSPQLCIDSNIHLVSRLLEAVQNSSSPTLFIHTSTDKAVNPTNLMGASKLLGEKLVTAAATTDSNPLNKYVITRFGNVLGSSGSVLPIFLNQILSDIDLTLTDKEMTRYVMTDYQAVTLILESPLVSASGDIIISDMPSIRIFDMANYLVDLVSEYFNHIFKGSIKVIGAFPGEKFYEELVSPEEHRRTRLIDNYFVIKPALPIGSNYSPSSIIATESLNSSTSALLNIDGFRQLIPKPFLTDLINQTSTVARHGHW